MRQRWLRCSRDERGQSLIIFVLSSIVLMAMTGLALDVGRVFVTKARLQRSVDAAALAGVQAFPNTSQAVSDALQYVAINESGASATAQQVGTDRKLRVTASKPTPMIFLSVLNVQPITVSATAVAGFGGILDAVLVMDTTGSMSGQPIVDARTAANTFVDTLLPDSSGNVVIGMAPYRSSYTNFCMRPDCVNVSSVQGLTGNPGTLHSKINAMTAANTTNICTGLWQAQNVLNGAGRHSDPSTLRVVVLLSDGDNNPQHATSNPPIIWPSACDPGGSSSTSGSGCQSTSTREAIADTKTYQLAQALKAQGVEIYVVGLSVCGSSSGALCNAGAIGGGASDTTADRNMLKCIASSRSGTNDHYLETNNSAQLTTLFQEIASEIATRLIE